MTDLQPLSAVRERAVGDELVSERGNQRLDYIDALRGVAALCVCLYHGIDSVAAQLSRQGAASGLRFGELFDLGRFGVILFFLISGFVIPFSLRGERPLRRFAITRAFRLYPPFWISVAVTALATWWVSGVLFPARQVLANLTMVPLVLRQPYLSGVYWTLFIELLFYGVCAALFAAGLLRRPLAILAVGVACAAVPLAGLALRAAGLPAPVVWVTAFLPYLFAGHLIHMASLRESRSAPVCAALLTLVALGMSPLLVVPQDHAMTASTPLGVLIASTAALLVFLAAQRHPFRPWPLLTWLGAISYSVYLFHIPVRAVAEIALPPASLASGVGFFLLLVLGTVALSALVYYAIEKPSIAAGKRIVHARRETLAMEVAP